MPANTLYKLTGKTQQAVYSCGDTEHEGAEPERVDCIRHGVSHIVERELESGSRDCREKGGDSGEVEQVRGAVFLCEANSGDTCAHG